jgi:hypothetical protein
MGHMKVSGSDSHYGLHLRDKLMSTKSFEEPVEGDGPNIISAALIEEAENLLNSKPRPSETELVSLYTPVLMEVVQEVSPLLRLVNSEYYPWLQCDSTHRQLDLKPDLFSTHYPMVQYMPAYKNAAPVCGRLFGKFADWKSRASIHCIWDAKWEIDLKAFGEKCKYLQIAGQDFKDHNSMELSLRCVLFSVHELWMINSIGNAIVKVVKCKWSDKGSKQRLLDFLQESDPWLQATRSLCVDMNVTIEDYSSRQEQEKEQEHEHEQEQKQSSFLGAGANGRVFKLRNNDRVIKIVIGKKSNEVEKEYTIMLKYQETNDLKNFVFPVVEGSFKSGHIGRLAYAGYLLAKEGEKIQNFNSVKIKKSLASALYGLHSCNVIHGDPRIDNVLVLDGSLKWIDFRQSDPFATKFSKRYDVEILLTSLNLSVPNVDNEIEEYVNDSSLEKLCQVLLKPKNQEFEK